MGTKAKVRFTIDIDGKAREMLSIRETNKGDLIIMRRSGEQADFGPHHADLLEQRFSVHPSPSSDGITITQRVSFADGRKADTYAHIKPHNGSLTWPVYAWAFQSLKPEKYIATPRTGDRVIKLGSYNPLRSVPVQIILVNSRRENIRNALSALPFNIHSLKYNIFNLWILNGFVAVPSTHLGCGVVVSGYSPRIDQQDLVSIPAGWSLGIPPPMIDSFVRSILDNLSLDLARRISRWLDTDMAPVTNVDLFKLCRLYTKVPI